MKNSLLIRSFSIFLLLAIFMSFACAQRGDTHKNMPCSSPKTFIKQVKDNFIYILYCIEVNKLIHAEIDTDKTEVDDKQLLKKVLEDFYKNEIKEIIEKEIYPKEKLFKIVEQMPRFPGCEYIIEEGGSNEEAEACAKQKMLNYIYTNLEYPEEAKSKRIEGFAVIRFTITSYGFITDIEILSDPGSGLGESAKNVVESFNNMEEQWTPGSQRGKLVNVQYILNIKFKLD